MYSRDTAGSAAKIGLFLSTLVLLLLVSDAAAQCYCRVSHHAHRRTVSSRSTRYAVRGYTAYNRETVISPSESRSFSRETVIVPSTSKYVVVTNGFRRGFNPELVDDDSPIAADPNFMDTARIASDWGFRDGLRKGYFAALNRRSYFPERHSRFHSAKRGYRRRFGSKQVYRAAYREAFVRGYRSGYRSVASRETLRAVRNY
jgi:hypothetical protein